jgi:hypothetical protein
MREQAQQGYRRTRMALAEEHFHHSTTGKSLATLGDFCDHLVRLRPVPVTGFPLSRPRSLCVILCV